MYEYKLLHVDRYIYIQIEVGLLFIARVVAYPWQVWNQD